MSWLLSVLVLVGVGLMALAGLGVLRMPDLFMRMHASTKGATLGLAFLLGAAALFFADLGVATKAVLTSLFVFLTAPVAAHLLGRAAYARKVPLWEHSLLDEGRGQIGGDESPEDAAGGGSVASVRSGHFDQSASNG
ncbi:MAG: monovalent cation/H(+) antiporter subunit G [Terrimicrobiaceae bacterium]|nr:monovalent cation/H(+) antiporter subunit G [Terrimicrobiaceae bacterium]